MHSVQLPLRILVVDDNHDAADTLAELLKCYGADVRVFYEAASTLQASEDFPFDAAVLDINLPGEFDGCELAIKLRDLAGTRPVLLIALTGISDPAARLRTTQAGFDMHVTKSMPPNIIQDALFSFAHGSRI